MVRPSLSTGVPVSPEKILAKAVYRAKLARSEPRRITIRNLSKRVEITVKRISPNFVWKVPEKYKKPINRIFPSIDAIIRATSDHFKVGILDIIGQGRPPSIMMPRHIAMFIARELTGKSFPIIGRAFGDRDHTTVMHGHHKIRDLLESEAGLVGHIEQIKEKLGLGDAT